MLCYHNYSPLLWPLSSRISWSSFSFSPCLWCCALCAAVYRTCREDVRRWFMPLSMVTRRIRGCWSMPAPIQMPRLLCVTISALLGASLRSVSSLALLYLIGSSFYFPFSVISYFKVDHFFTSLSFFPLFRLSFPFHVTFHTYQISFCYFVVFLFGMLASCVDGVVIGESD